MHSVAVQIVVLLLTMSLTACGNDATGVPDAGLDAGLDARPDAGPDAGGCGLGRVETDAGCLGDLGATCDAGPVCASGICVDGRCCDTACDGICEACGADGACGPAPDGEGDALCATQCLAGVCQPCPADQVRVEDVCLDRYEAPNRAGALPLVMYTFVEAEAWCAARGRRLCFDDEWTRACEGLDAWAYPYGTTHQPGVCNDEEIWRTYSPSLLSAWPPSVSSPEATSLETLLDAARGVSTAAAGSADHIEWLYQGEPSGDATGCTYADEGVYDLCGNVEEWTRRRDGGYTDFHGNLKGRYWAETRTCQSNITSHGDYFRFYEIGFRCCSDPRVE